MVHLFVGVYDGPVMPDPEEAADTAWASRTELRARIARRPEAYTYWFRHYLRHYADAMFAGLAA